MTTDSGSARRGAARSLRLVETEGSDYRGVSAVEAVEDFRLACLSRSLDDRQRILHAQGRAYFQIAGAGHEALLTALARSLRPGYDWFFPYYRDLPLVLSLGMSPRDVLLHSVGSSEDPNSGGRQMPSHWSSVELNIVTQSSATGSQVLPAMGCSESGRYILKHNLPLKAQGDEVTYVSLGEGATSEGEFWESLNTACRHRLPLLYLIADNGYAISVPSVDQSPAPISELVSSFPNLRVSRIDGRDYFASRVEGAAAVASIRNGNGPSLIHATVTRPYSHSSSDNQTKYRTPDEIAEESGNDPLVAFERELLEAGILDEPSAIAIREEVAAIVLEAANAVLEAPRPDPSTVLDHLTAPPKISARREPQATTGEAITFGETVRRTLHEIMAEDERVRVFGEDVADASDQLLGTLEGLGGVFGNTRGLQSAFGSDRCFNTPIAEAAIIGRGVGQAIRGLRPVPEIQFFDYIWPAMHQIRTEAATTRWRSNGAYHVPLIIRCAIGGYLAGGAIWHSQSGESIFTHIPGLIVMFPSRARDVAGLMRTAMRCEDPVMFFEHKHLFRQRYAADPFPEPDYLVPLGSAATIRKGHDLTVVTWGATVHRCELAADQLSANGTSVEILDLRTLAPWDRESVAASVRKTSRLLVVHEDVITSGFGAEVAAFAADECFSDLDAPVRRVGALDTWVGYEPTLERATLPQVDGIADAMRSVLSF